MEMEFCCLHGTYDIGQCDVGMFPVITPGGALERDMLIDVLGPVDL
jgi:hypothetical protein